MSRTADSPDPGEFGTPPARLVLTVTLLLTVVPLINLATALRPGGPLPLHAARLTPPLDIAVLLFWASATAAIAIGVMVMIRRMLEPRPIVPVGSPSLDDSRLDSLFLWVLAVMFVGVVFHVFRMTRFDELIYHGDFPYQYMVSKRNIELLKSGCLFAWEHDFLGGYPTYCDLSKDLSLLLMPLTPFMSFNVAFHVLIVGAILIMPVLFFCWLRQFDVSTGTRRRSLLFFVMLLLANERTISNGMITAIVGLDLFLLITCLAMRSQRRQWHPVTWVPIVALSLLLAHIHASFFVFSGGFMLFLWFSGPWNRIVFRNVFLMCTVLLCGLAPLVVGAVLNRSIVISSSKLFEEGFWHGFSQFLNGTIIFYDWGRWGTHGLFLMVLLPATLIPALRRTMGVPLRFAWFVFLLTALKTTEIVGFALSRNDYILIPFIALAWGVLVRYLAPGRALVLDCLSIMVLMQIYLPFPRPLAHCPEDYFRPLTSLMVGDSSERVLAENAARWPAARPPHRSEKARLPHYVPYLQMESGRPFLSNPGADPYHYSRYRLQTITSGTFRGDAFTDIDGEEFERHLRQWRVRWLVTWSCQATSWLRQNDERFSYQGSLDGIHLYRFEGPLDPEVTVSGCGSGRILTRSTTSLTIGLNESSEVSVVRVSMNYSPHWTAQDSRGRAVDLFEDAGMIAFHRPTAGEETVTLTYAPLTRVYLLTLVSILALIAILVKGRRDQNA